VKNPFSSSAADRRNQRVRITVAILLVLVAVFIANSRPRNGTGGIASPSATLMPSATMTLTAAQALAEANRAITLNSNDAQAYFQRGMAYVSIAFQEKDAAKQAQIARHAIADLRLAQRLGYPLPSDVELAVTQLEAQLGRPEVTDPPGS
jgi:hypothetical protein